MPVQPPQWSEFLSCPICCNVFSESSHRPISLGCGHTVCKICLMKLRQKKCPFDQNQITVDLNDLPINFALLQLVGVVVKDKQGDAGAGDMEERDLDLTEVSLLAENMQYYRASRQCIEELATYLKPTNSGSSPLSRPMQRKLVSLVNCQLIEEEGRTRALRAARSLVERTLTELILQHQNPTQLSAHLWAAVRARGCQFLGPGMQEEVLKLILLALEDGSALSRKVLVLFVVQRLETQYPQASKTAIGHVVQLLYRASCFKVTKREEESSLMQLKEEFRVYDALRREHDSQIVQIATEAGLRIAPDQWSSLLYGDSMHKSHMQSIIDKLQTPQSLSQGISELLVTLQRSGDPCDLARLTPHFELIADIDPSPDVPPPLWQNLETVMKAVKTIVSALVDFSCSSMTQRQEAPPVYNSKFKTSLCRDLFQRNACPRGANCTFAHSDAEMEKFRTKNRRALMSGALQSKSRSHAAHRKDGEFAGHNQNVPSTFLHQKKQIGDLKQVQKSAFHVHGPGFNTTLPTSHIQQQSLYTSPISIPQDRSNRSLAQKPRVSSFELPSHADGQSDSSESSPHSDHSIKEEASFGSYEDMPMCSVSPLYFDQTPIPLGHYDLMNPGFQVSPKQPFSATLTLPPNPYTSSDIQCPVSGKSVSQTLDELYKRRTELLAQLNKTSISVSSPVSVYSQATSSMATSSDVKAKPKALNLGKSAADSLATTHVTASLAKHDMKTDPLACRKTGNMNTHAVITSSATQNEASGESVIVSASSIHTCQTETTGVMTTIPQITESIEKRSESEVPACTGLAMASCGAQDMMHNTAPETTTEYVKYDVPNVQNEEEEYARPEESNDEFVPFKHTIVSKFGPISRGGIRARVKQADPLQVTASLGKDKEVTPVTAVTPIDRPFPITSPIPSRYSLPHPQGAALHLSPTPVLTGRVMPVAGNPRFSPSGVSVSVVHPGGSMGTISTVAGSVMTSQPLGKSVASSLATAHMKMPLVPSAGPACPTEPYTLWAVKDRISSRSKSEREHQQIRTELARIGKQIENLQVSEDGRLARELQAVELSIRETEKQMQQRPVEVSAEVLQLEIRALEQQMSLQQLEMAQQAQLQREMAEAHQRRQELLLQEKLDRRLAEQMVVDEARQMCAVTSRDGGVTPSNSVLFKRRL